MNLIPVTINRADIADAFNADDLRTAYAMLLCELGETIAQAAFYPLEEMSITRDKVWPEDVEEAIAKARETHAQRVRAARFTGAL